MSVNQPCRQPFWLKQRCRELPASGGEQGHTYQTKTSNARPRPKLLHHDSIKTLHYITNFRGSFTHTRLIGRPKTRA